MLGHYTWDTCKLRLKTWGREPMDIKAFDMKRNILFLIVIAAGCSTTSPSNDVVLNLPVSMEDSCVPLKANIYWVKVNGHILPVESPKNTNITVPANATSLFINCQEEGNRPKHCGNTGVTTFMTAQEFQVNLQGSASFELQCRITASKTSPLGSIEVLVTKPYKGQLEPAPH
jgi:hypothetical protein